MIGPAGSAISWPDNYFNLSDLGSPVPHTMTGHWAALIGYIGSNPPAPGSFHSRSTLTEAQKIFLVGRRFLGSAPRPGTLWLSINDDAYSGFRADNRGQVVASITDQRATD
jgi:hypothetical protein